MNKFLLIVPFGAELVFFFFYKWECYNVIMEEIVELFILWYLNPLLN